MYLIFQNIIEIGFTLGLLVGAVLFVPQILELFKTKNSQNASLITFLGFNAIQLFVVFHGVIHKDHLLIYGSLIKFIVCAMVSYLIIWYRFKKGNI